MRARLLPIVILLTASMLAGCAQNAPPPSAEDPRTAPFERCAHPWPCADGTEWPHDLEAPDGGFALAEIIHARVAMRDGVELDGAVWLPDVPDGVRVPVVLWVTPYAGQCRGGTSCDDVPHDSREHTDLFRFLWSNGYAAAEFSLRGTGLSGGCFDYYGTPSQLDMPELVEWLAAETWSNGRVGMWGVSAMGTTPWMAAIGAPPALKAIAPSGIISDLYLNRFTPQGAPWFTAGSFQTEWGSRNSIVPPGGIVRQSSDAWPDALATAAQNQPERVCPGAVQWVTAGPRAEHTDDRDPTFWAERRLIDHFDDITAAVLVQHGFHDGGHAFQDDAIWPSLAQTPRRMFLGQWGHELTPDEQLGEYVAGNTTHAVLLDWFDFWLKGIGDPPRVGLVDHQATDGSWRETTAWPPAEARDELLYLAGDALATSEGTASTLRAAQLPPTPSAADVPYCAAEPDAASRAGARVLYLSEPVAARAIIAGNPMAHLDLTSDQPGGTVEANLYVVDAKAPCGFLIAAGAADLRFHNGNDVARDFPVGTPTSVRIDLWSTSSALTEGARLLLVMTATGDDSRHGQVLYAPTLAIGSASHIVLPLVEGTFDGAAPTMTYPPRPYVPSEP